MLRNGGSSLTTTIQNNPGEDDEIQSKYQKRERRRHQRQVQQVAFLIIAVVVVMTCLVFLAGKDDSTSSSTTSSTLLSVTENMALHEKVAGADGDNSEQVLKLRRAQFLTNLKKHSSILKAPNHNNLSHERQQRRRRPHGWGSLRQGLQEASNLVHNNIHNNPARMGRWGSLRERLQGSKDTIVQAWQKAAVGLANAVTGDSQLQSSPARSELETVEQHMHSNGHYGLRFLRPSLLVPLPGRHRFHDKIEPGSPRLSMLRRTERNSDYFYVERMDQDPLDWEKEFRQIEDNHKLQGPRVDFTKHSYQYPPLLSEPPKTGGYPKLDTLGNIMKRWPQDDIDHPPTPFVESLIHFNFSNPVELEMAKRFRDVELPFKLYDIPELDAARVKWTDEYVASHFDRSRHPTKTHADKNLPPPAMGTAQESVNNYFAFFVMEMWNVETMGLAPVRNNDWTFELWSKHAKYADHVALDADQPHFYYQAGVQREERYQSPDQWTFISRDLPNMSSPTETFFVFHPNEQKGIQCRFGERGVTAATHYDSGRNMVAMITGAKRYILSPPKECSKLAIDGNRRSSVYRHSLLNFGYITLLDDDSEKSKNMSDEERGWLQRASTAQALDTVLKAGEVLYIPSHWFHYISSLQKSAQCNVRSGIDQPGSQEFGGLQDVLKCNAP